MYCEYCGSKLNDATVCPYCGAPVKKKTINTSETTYENNGIYSSRNRLVVALLAFFVGTFGVHNFYLGYKGRGIAQLLLTTVGTIFFIGPFISGVWAFVDTILYLFVNDKKDADGKVLRGLNL